MPFKIEILVQGRWSVFLPVFDQERAYLRFAEAVAAMPNAELRMLDGAGKVLATSTPDPRPALKPTQPLARA